MKQVFFQATVTILRLCFTKFFFQSHKCSISLEQSDRFKAEMHPLAVIMHTLLIKAAEVIERFSIKLNLLKIRHTYYLSSLIVTKYWAQFSVMWRALLYSSLR